MPVRNPPCGLRRKFLGAHCRGVHREFTMRRIASLNCSSPHRNQTGYVTSSRSNTSIVRERSATIAESIVRER